MFNFVHRRLLNFTPGQAFLTSLPQIFRTKVDMSHSSSAVTRLKNTQFFMYDSVASTQDVCKDLLRQINTSTSQTELDDVFCVLAKAQHTGRGSRGRTWMGMEGNMFLTIAIKQACIPCPLTLIPLRIGTLICPRIRSRVQSEMPVFVKWPNDLIIGEEKVCGTLVEIENGYVIVGVGCNVARAPAVPTDGADAGRVATSLADHSPAIAADSNAAMSLAADIAQDVRLWASGSAHSERADDIVQCFQDQMNMEAVQRLRSGHDVGKEVLPLRVNGDGTLQVRIVETGEEKALIVDYLC